ncbi:hypothetical protein [Vibrio splendidus]|uniref:hypothetical protein n=1 Tax=Vibrio splendidus TaxID=29497 RepID=UPI000CC80720|nr:hypothetical protein [Vibrio splendidus]PMP51654.1 hypothetical protein BCS83_02320 [Vibrio splendidus]
MKFSPSQIAFYLPKLEATYRKNNNWPDDLIDLTDDEVATFVKLSPPEGMTLGITESGRPCFVEVALPTKEEMVLIETSWRDGELEKVLNRIDQYEKDQSYPEEFRTSPIQSHDDFLLLLNDRKVLSDYPDLETFPFGERPVLSGLAN